MSPFWAEILGKNNDPGVMAAAFVFALIGHALVLLGGTMLRNPASTASPIKFSFSYLLWDNAKRIFYVLLLVVVGIRFLPDLTGMQVTGWGGFLVGSGLDVIALIIKQRTKLLDPSAK